MENLNGKKFQNLSNSEMQAIAGGRWHLEYATCVPSEGGGVTTIAVWTRNGHTKETYD